MKKVQSEKVQRDIELAYLQRERELEKQKERDWKRFERDKSRL